MRFLLIFGMPKFKHDCQCCTFLGSFEGSDLYHCAQGGFPTVIARHSEEDGDYTSGMSFVGVIPALTEAHKRAVAKKLSC